MQEQYQNNKLKNTYQKLKKRLIAIFWMLLGVFIYTFCIGSLSSLLSRLDIRTMRYNQLLTTLLLIKKEYGIPDSLFLKIKNHLKYGKK